MMWILMAAGAGALVLVAFLVFLFFFERGLAYHVEEGGPTPESEECLHVIAALADAQLHRGARIEALDGGEAFYDAQLTAIRGAQSSVHSEQNIFCENAIGQRFVDALA